MSVRKHTREKDSDRKNSNSRSEAVLWIIQTNPKADSCVSNATTVKMNKLSSAVQAEKFSAMSAAEHYPNQPAVNQTLPPTFSKFSNNSRLLFFIFLISFTYHFLIFTYFSFLLLFVSFISDSVYSDSFFPIHLYNRFISAAYIFRITAAEPIQTLKEEKNDEKNKDTENGAGNDIGRIMNK